MIWKSYGCLPGRIVVAGSTGENVDGRRITFSVVADDGIDTISKGTHGRFITGCRRFKSKAAHKQADALKNISQSKRTVFLTLRKMICR